MFSLFDEPKFEKKEENKKNILMLDFEFSEYLKYKNDIEISEPIEKQEIKKPTLRKNKTKLF